MRFKLAAKTYQEMVKRRDSIELIQTNIRAFQYLKDWEWMKIIFKIKPLISQAEEGKKMQELEKNYDTVKAALEKEKKRRIELEEQGNPSQHTFRLCLISYFYLNWCLTQFKKIFSCFS